MRRTRPAARSSSRSRCRPRSCWCCWAGWRPRRTNAPSLDTLDPYEAAWLSGGVPRLAATAIGLLIDRGALRVRTVSEGVGRRRHAVTRLTVTATPAPDELHPVEAACLAAARDDVLRFERAQLALQVQAIRIRARLRAAGLAMDPATIRPARAAVAIVAGAWLAVELERIVHALSTPRPMAFLVLLALATAVVFVLLVLRNDDATWRGQHLLRALSEAMRRESRLRADHAPRGREEAPIAARHLPLTLALLGPGAVLAQPMFVGLDDAIGAGNMRLAKGSCGDGGGGCGSGGSSCGGGGGSCGGGCGGGCGG